MANSISCEILFRRKRNLIILYALLYIGVIVFFYLLTPSYKNGRMTYSGLLSKWHMHEYIQAASITRIFLLAGSAFMLRAIFTLTLRIRGEITITDDAITIAYQKKQPEVFNIKDITNLDIQFNYFKKNDIEPRNMVSGNNNLISFSKGGRFYKYEFLLQTIEEDETFRAIMDNWSNNNIAFQYKTVLSDF